MEGTSVTTDKLVFVEEPVKYKLTNGENRYPNDRLIAVANNHRLIFVSLPDKLVAIDFPNISNGGQSQVQEINSYKFAFQLDHSPTLLSVAYNGDGSHLLVCGVQANTPVIEVFDLNSNTSMGKVKLSQCPNVGIEDEAWHPDRNNPIVALTTGSGHLLVLAINDKNKTISIVYDAQCEAMTCCWSPKGKNLAVGLYNGQIFRLEPVMTASSFTFKDVANSTLTLVGNMITPEHSVVRLRWINRTYLMAVHAKLNKSTFDTVHTLLTAKPGQPHKSWQNILMETKQVDKYYAYMENLGNAVICMSNASSEAAVIGLPDKRAVNSNQDLSEWQLLLIDREGARLDLPLDENNCETLPLGLTLAEIEGRHVLVIYMSDGKMCMYSLRHSEDILFRPSAKKEGANKVVTSAAAPAQQQQQQTMSSFSSMATPGMSTFGSASSGGFGAPASFGASAFSGLGQTPPKPAFGSPAFSSLSSAPGAATFGSAPAFGSGFATSNPVTFGTAAQSATTAAPAAAAPTFGSSTEPKTFGALASSTTATKTSTGFGALSTEAPKTFGSLAAAASSGVPPAPAPASTFGSSGGLFGGLGQTTSGSSTFGSPATGGGLSTPFNFSLPDATKSAATTVPHPGPAPTPAPAQAPPQPALATATPQQAATPQLPNQQQHPKQQQQQHQKECTTNKYIEAPARDAQLHKLKSIVRDNAQQLESLKCGNDIRSQLDTIQEFETVFREAQESIKQEISELDIGMLENHYLIDFINASPRKKSINPNVNKLLQKLDSFREKLKGIATSLNEVNLVVDVACDDARRQRSHPNRKPSPDIIFKTLATNQKLINVLKAKLHNNTSLNVSSYSQRLDDASVLSNGVSISEVVSKTNPTAIKRLREFLSSRGESIPVRRPLQSLDTSKH